MENQKFKHNMRCFVECVIDETKSTKDYPIFANIGNSVTALSFTDTGFYHTSDTAPSLFTTEEVAAKLHPELMAEIERLRGEKEKLASKIDDLERHNTAIARQNELLRADNELVRKENERITKTCNDLDKKNQYLLDELSAKEAENEKNLTEIDRLTAEHNHTVQDLSARLDLFMSKYHAVSRQLEDEILRRHRALPAEIDKATEMLFAEKLEMQNEIELKEAEINTLKIEKNFLLKLLKFKKR